MQRAAMKVSGKVFMDHHLVPNQAVLFGVVFLITQVHLAENMNLGLAQSRVARRVPCTLSHLLIVPTCTLTIIGNGMDTRTLGLYLSATVSQVQSKNLKPLTKDFLALS